MRKLYKFATLLIALFLSLSLAHSAPKLKLMIFEFQDLTGTGAGDPIARYITRVVATDPRYEISYVPMYKLSDQSVSGMLRYAKDRGYQLVLTGRITDSRVNYSSASVPTPFGGVSVRSATATVSYLASLYSVGEGKAIFERNFSGSETVSNIGGWAWTSWGYVDINSSSFLNSPMGKALDKAAKELYKYLEKVTPELQRKYAKPIREESSSSSQASQISGSPDKYERVIVYDNDFTGVSLGTAFIKGMRQMSSTRVVTTENCGSVNCPKLTDGKDGLMLKMNPVKPPFELELSFSLRKGSSFRVYLGEFNNRSYDKSWFLSKGLVVELGRGYGRDMSLKINYVSHEGDRRQELQVAGRALPGTSPEEKEYYDIRMKIAITKGKLKVYVNDLEGINMDLPDELKEMLPPNYTIGMFSFNSYLKRVKVYKLKVKSEHKLSGTSTDKISRILDSLKRLGGDVKVEDGLYEVSFNESSLFTGATSPEPSESFEDILDLIDDLAIAVGADSVKVKLRTKYTAKASEVEKREKEILKEYLEELAEGNYRVKVMRSSSLRRGVVTFKLRG